MQCSSRVSACRRELNSHEAAKPRRISQPRWRSEDRKFQARDGSAASRYRIPKMRGRRATSRHGTAWEPLVFSQFAGPPRRALLRRQSAAGGGLNPWRTTIYSAEREAIVACQRELQGLGRLAASAVTARRCLTPRSSGAPTAGHQARSAGTVYIFCCPGLASCRRRPLSSNVRQRKHTPPVQSEHGTHHRPRRPVPAFLLLPRGDTGSRPCRPPGR